jgi:hypothetical protein
LTFVSTRGIFHSAFLTEPFSLTFVSTRGIFHSAFLTEPFSLTFVRRVSTGHFSLGISR